jgi:hypothetical protein
MIVQKDGLLGFDSVRLARSQVWMSSAGGIASHAQHFSTSWMPTSQKKIEMVAFPHLARCSMPMHSI